MPPIGPSGFISPTPWKQPLPPHTYKMSNWQNPQSADFYSPSCQSYQPLPPNTNTVSNWENAQSTEFRSSPCPWNQPIPFPILNFTNWKNPPSNDLPGTSTAYSSLPQQL
ncbi:hypothetical protein GCK72_022471 [Caenorhabditis remanei]|uniref:Uncharacterized protein n=2 Tax=Caenorhabditis remanei TaxID=31234 RepID=A0A6A5FTT9_CAERE|nr:hypothetical protein GCK72_022471 [Caenorhabditis remanei]KAF1746020.1 hypothetical protein GCK72_022471 [Caenorhabditis remanei]